VFAAVGWHPTHVLDAPPDIRPALRELCKNPKVVAIGETGLDFFHPPDHGEVEPYYRRQAEIFQQQLEVAAETGLNCVVHTRQSFEAAAVQLDQFRGKVRGVFHCFSEDTAALKRALEMGSIVSFTGNVTFKNAQTIRDTLMTAPLGHFMFETDCPYLAPIPHRGQRSEPAFVKEIADFAAQVKNCSLAELSAATCGTARNFFRNLE
jgi:TatD DNase family protein